MQSTRKIGNNVYWIGSCDRRLERFENLFPIPKGMAYNSYLILDEKTVVMDTVDDAVERQFYENIDYLLKERELDYLVVNHVEPDHCSGIMGLMDKYPSMTIVGTQKAIQMIGQFYERDLTGRTLAVKDGDVLELGEHKLQFYTAPMVHWPEVMVTFEEKEGMLFSADAFGTFGAFSGTIFNDEIEFERDWLPEARRYYSNIVGKYGMQVQALLKKVGGLDIRMICPLHGPIWRSNLEWFLEKYDRWSKYEPEEKGVLIVYGSIYGNTERAVNAFASKLAEAGVKNIAMYDVSRIHVSELISEMFRFSHIVLASASYNAGLFPAMESLLLDMKGLTVRNRKVVLIENGSWALSAKKVMEKELGEMKGMEILEHSLSIKSTLPQSREEELDVLVEQLVASLGE